MAYNHFPRKEYGRIFVQKPEDIPKVKEIIKRMDSFEYEYLPDDFVAVYQEKHVGDYTYVPLIYTHKFDSLDLNVLQAVCWRKGIPIFCPMNCMEDVVRIDDWEENNDN